MSESTRTDTLLRRDEAGRLVVTQPGSVPGRVFGFLFMAPGLKLLWDFGNAIIEVARAGDWRWSGLVGFSVWLLMASVFLVPGWLIGSFRRHVVIDRTDRTVLQVNDFLVYRWSSSRSLSGFTAVRAFVPPRRSAKRSPVTHHVELRGNRGKDKVIVFMDEDAERARSVGRELAAFTGLRFRDDLDRDVDEDAEEPVD